MVRIQKNKATSGYFGFFKVRLVKFRREFIEFKGGGGGGGEGFDVVKIGDVRIGFVGKVNFILFNFLLEIQMFFMFFQIMYVFYFLGFFFCVYC